MSARTPHDVRTLSRQLVGHFTVHVAACGTLPGDALHGDITAVTRDCLELTINMLEGREPGDKLERLRRAAADWAREGIPVDAVIHAVHESFKFAFDLLLPQAGPGELLDAQKHQLLRILDTITAAVALAYVREHQAAVTEHHNAVHTLVSALLAGHPTSTMARASGIDIEPAYAVLAVSIPPHRDESHPAVDTKVVARRKLRRLQTELANRYTGRALSLLSIDGGTILIPEHAATGGELDNLVARLSGAAQVQIIATVINAATPRIPAAADCAHELLDTVLRMDGAPGLYRFADLAMEYQLTRPGPGLDRLGRLLDPLDGHPELLDTLRRHVATGLSRQRTARQLQIHTNTVDYRLKRIGQLTGLDPALPSELWRLRAALVARTHRKARPGNAIR